MRLFGLLNKIHNSGDLKSFFYIGEMILGTVFVAVIWIFRPRSPESNFRVRESDLKKQRLSSKGQIGHDDSLAQARYEPKETHNPLRLEGIRIDGAPHEILGVRPNATPQEIQQHFRELMKRYHPDRVGPQGSREWKDAQRIADAIIRAKDQLLKK